MKKSVRVQDILGLLNRFSPPALAESWDNPGLQVGDPEAKVDRVVTALEPTLEVLENAVKNKAQVLICHHPLIFNSLKNIRSNDPLGKKLFFAIQNHLAIISAHTNLDKVSGGLNDWLADRLGIEKCKPLAAEEGSLIKLVVFVPEDAVEQVAEAIFNAGAGHIGRYDQCAFRSRGAGSFRPGVGTTPYIGEEGKTEIVDEIRLETVFPREREDAVVRKLLKAHPYEEVAYDLYPLLNDRPDTGMGRIGYLTEATSLEAFARTVQKALSTESVRMIGAPKKSVQKIALCSGSGASFIYLAKRQGADVLVTGDIKYHDAQNALEMGLACIDAGHFATERIAAGELAMALQAAADKGKLAVTFTAAEKEKDPITTIVI